MVIDCGGVDDEALTGTGGLVLEHRMIGTVHIITPLNNKLSICRVFFTASLCVVITIGIAVGF